MARGSHWLAFGIVCELGAFLLLQDDADGWRFADVVDSATTAWTLGLFVLVLILLVAIVHRRRIEHESQALEVLLMSVLAGFILADVLTPDPTVLLHLHHEWIEIIAAAAAAVSYWAYWRVNTPRRAPNRGGYSA